MVVGIYDASDGSPINTGGIELYELNSNTSQYEQVGIISHGTTEEAYLGHTTSINNDGSIFAAGQYQRNVDTTGTSSSTIEGGVLIFERSGENINIIADISLNGHSDTTQFKEMGRSIELNGAGDRIIIGGTYDDSVSGTGKHRVYIYQKQSNNTWDKVFDISNSTNIGMNFGLSVAMSNDGNVIAVATQERNDASEDGVVFIYELTGNGIGSNLTYTQRGSNITLNGIDDMDTFGASISLNADGSVIAIASGSLDTFNGHAYIYKYLNSEWKLIRDIPGSTNENLGGIHNYDINNNHLISDEDGICLDATGNLVAIGAPNLYSADNTDSNGNGSAYLYRNQTYTLGVNDKLQVKGDIVIDNGDIDVDGNIIVSGSRKNNIISSALGIGNHFQSTGTGSRNVFEGGSNYIYSQEMNNNGATGGHNRLYATQAYGYNDINATGLGGANYIEANETGSNRLKVNGNDKIVTEASTTTLTNVYNYIDASGSGGTNYIEANVTGSNRLKVDGNDKIVTNASTTTLTNVYNYIEANVTGSNRLIVNGNDKIVTNASTTTLTNTDILLVGNVGIGTYDPQVKLDVELTTGEEVNIGENLKIQNEGKKLVLHDSRLLGDDNQQLGFFYTDNDGEATNNPTLKLMQNKNSLFYGNVGIGTTDPQAKLDVAGSLSAGATTLSGALTVNHALTATGAITGGSLSTAGTLNAGAITGGSLSTAGTLNAGATTLSGDLNIKDSVLKLQPADADGTPGYSPYIVLDSNGDGETHGGVVFFVPHGKICIIYKRYTRWIH